MTFKQFVKIVEAAAVAAALVFVIMLFANDGGSTSGGTESVGATLYSSNCASCHGADGSGALGPELAGVVTEEYPDIEDQIAFVAEGEGAMPAFGPGSSRELSEEDLRAVVEYTRTELGG